MKKSDKKSEIIAVGTDLISVNGFNATGIEAVLRQAGVPKGSFYHYFRNKEEFGMAVIDNFAAQYDEKLDSFFNDHTVPPLERIRNYFEHSLAHMSEKQFTKGCLIGNLGQELADQNERFRERLATIFSSWKKRFGSCLQEAQERGEFPVTLEPDVVADFILAGWEGAILRSKVNKSPEPIRNFVDTLFVTILRTV
ncbi:TetR/AcrR family transcriptional regulator [Desulfogranum japonicum]|uniref:TetR/AcrR family transcriptional regulator n=1 Tax=Desulfogranum japonicum TaxID=231447 RepID=UPI0004215F79|nr:TetR/AcrR family transcriptional regulator [Desulfogranum japonicum]